MLNLTTPNDEIETPDEIFNYFKKRYNIVFDVCATDQNKKCKYFFDKHDDAISKNWNKISSLEDAYLWCNPPYSRSGIAAFAHKIYIESELANVNILAFVRLDNTKWFNKLMKNCSTLYIFDFKVKFKHHNTGSTFPTCVVDVNKNKLCTALNMEHRLICVQKQEIEL